MADDSASEEQWLYGDSNPDKPEEQPEDSCTTPEKDLQQFINPDGPDTNNTETTEVRRDTKFYCRAHFLSLHKDWNVCLILEIVALS